MGRFQLGLFDLEQRVGSGAQGEVWAARHVLTDLPAAVKIGERTGGGLLEVQRWLAEVRAAATLNHPNIALTLDCGDVTEADLVASEGALKRRGFWIAMELASGGTLDERLALLDWERLRELAISLLDGLAHAHAMGVLHRDIKPANVLFRSSDSWQPLLADFGLASGSWEDERPRVAGTPAFSAPEQLTGEWWLEGPPSDLYALGGVLWWACTGRPPFGDHDVRAVAYAHRHAPLPGFEPRFPVPAGFEAWLRTLLEKRPRDRFLRAADAKQGLVDLAEDTWSLRWVPDWRELQPRQRGEGRGVGLVGIRRLPLVGRLEERDALWAVFRAAVQSNRPRAALVTGPRGSGVDRLAEWLVQTAHQGGTGDGFVFRTGESITDWLGRILRIDHMRDPAQHARRWLAGLPVDWPGLGEKLVGFLAHGRDPVGTALALVRATSEVRTPVVVARHAVLRDSAVRALFRELEGWNRPCVLLLLGERFEADALREVLQYPEVPQVEVSALSSLEAVRLIHEALPLEPALVDRLAAATGGLPGAIAATVEGWVVAGRLHRTPTGLALRDDDQPFLPESLVDTVRRHIVQFEHAHPALLRPLQVAAVLGSGFDAEQWARACRAAGVADPEGALTALSRANMMVARDGVWSCAHPVLAEVLRHDLGEAAAVVNRAAASVVGPDQLVRRIRLLMDAGDLDVALGEVDARDVRRPSGLAELHLELLERLGLRGDARYGEALVALLDGLGFRSDAGMAVVERLVDWIDETGHERFRGHVVRGRAVALFNDGRRTEARALLESQLEHEPPGDLRAQCLRHLAIDSLHNGDDPTGLRLVEEALGCATLPRLRASCLLLQASRAEPEDTLVMAEAAAALAREAGDLPTCADAMVVQASALGRMGDDEGAAARSGDAMRLKEEAGEFATAAHLTHASHLIGVGRAESAVPILEAFCRIVGSRSLEMLARAALCRAHATLGDWSAAHAGLLDLDGARVQATFFQGSLGDVQELATRAGKPTIAARAAALRIDPEQPSQLADEGHDALPASVGPITVSARIGHERFVGTDDDGAVRVVERGASVAGFVRHPNVVPVVARGETAGVEWSVYDWSGELDLAGHGPVSDAEAFQTLAADLLVAAAGLNALGMEAQVRGPADVVRRKGRWALLGVGAGGERPDVARDLQQIAQVLEWAAPDVMPPEHADWLGQLGQSAGAAAADALSGLDALSDHAGDRHWRRWDFPEIGLHGRHTEQGLLWDALTRVESTDQPQVVLVRGPSGIGRSRLLDWFGIVGRSSGRARVVEVQHGGSDTPSPLDGLGGAVLRLVGRDEGEQSLPERLAELGIAPGALGPWRRLRRLARNPDSLAFVACLAECLPLLAAGRTMVVCVDDAERGDASLQLAEWVLREQVPVLVVCAVADDRLVGRPDEAGRLARLRALSGVVDLELGPLADDAARLLLDEAGVAPDAADPLLQAAAGNPAQLLALQDGKQASRTQATELRVRPLFETAGWAWPLTVMAALGPVFELDLWVRATGAEGGFPIALLTRLRAERVLRARDGECRLEVAAFLPAIERLASAGQMQRAHAAVAAALPPSGRRGHHLALAGEVGEALDELLGAASAENRPLDSVRFAEHALKLLDGLGAGDADPRRGQALEAIARFSGRAMQTRRHRRAVSAFVAWADQHGTPGARVDAALQLASSEVSGGDYGSAIFRLRGLLESTRDTGDTRSESRVLTALAGALKVSGSGDVVDVRRQALALTEPGSLRWAGTSLTLAHDLAEQGALAEASEVLDAAATLLLSMGPRFEPEVLNVRGELARMAGRLDEARERFTAAVDARRRVFAPPTHPLLNLALTELEAGDPEAAREALWQCHLGMLEVPLLLWVHSALEVGACVGTADWAGVDSALYRLEALRVPVVEKDALAQLEAAAARLAAARREDVAARAFAIAREARKLLRDRASGR